MRQVRAFLMALFFCSTSLTAIPIDVIIPCVEKDLATLDLCIEGIRQNGAEIRRIIVISDCRLTTQAEWFDEKQFPFSIRDVAIYLNGSSKSGWYFQQLVKLYAPYVIPDLSSNILCLDADTIFLSPVKFVTDSGDPLYTLATEYHKPYFDHMERLLPGLKRMFPKCSGISHHMLFQKHILDRLFQRVQSHHKLEFWKAFCLSVDPRQVSECGASEYEIYFNFLFSMPQEAHKMRKLRWANIRSLENLNYYKVQRYQYVSCHAYGRS